jgi:hypothetical protein
MFMYLKELMKKFLFTHNRQYTINIILYMIWSSVGTAVLYSVLNTFWIFSSPPFHIFTDGMY